MNKKINRKRKQKIPKPIKKIKFCLSCDKDQKFQYDRIIGHGMCSVCGYRNIWKKRTSNFSAPAESGKSEIVKSVEENKCEDCELLIDELCLACKQGETEYLYNKDEEVEK